MLPRSFYFLRHGETDWNRQMLVQGHTDIPLNETGRIQARNAISVLQRFPIDRIISSPLARAHETASIVNAVLKKPLTADAQLKERNFGAMEGMTTSAIDAFRADMKEKGLAPEENGYPCPPEGEPYAVFKARTLAVIAYYLTHHAGENLLFVAHGGLYRVLKRCLSDDVDMSPNAQPFYFEKSGQKWVFHVLTDR